MVVKLTVLLTSFLLLIQCGNSDKMNEEQVLPQDLSRQINILFQNDYVLVTKLTLAPGEAVPMHRQNNRVLLADNDCELEVVEGDKNPVRRQFSRREFAWYDAMIHSVRNPGTDTVVVYSISRKQTPLPIGKDQTAKNRKVSNKLELFANDEMRVNEVFLTAGKTGASFSNEYRLAFALSEFEMKQIYEDGGEETILYRPGIFVWSNPQVVKLENIGASDARYLLFEFLK